MSKLRALDLFCGAAGGWSVGLHANEIGTVAACEIDPWRRERFSKNFPNAVMYDDVRSLTATRLCDDLGYLPEIIVGSPPCQDASCANAKGKGVDGERTGLFFEAVRLVREVRPDWACFENVPGLKSRGYDRVHDELEAAGYTVRPFVVGAWHAGADHKRNRVWISAHAKESTRRGRPNVAQPEPQACVEADILRHAPQMFGTAIARNKSDRVAARLWSSLWNGGVAARGGMVDGIPKGLAEKLLSAYGDAVVPAVTGAVIRSILPNG